MKRSLPILLFSLSAGLVVSAAPDLSKLPAASTRKGLTYAKDIKPLFEASCTRCHGEERQRGELRLDSLEAVLKGGENGKILTAGKGHESALVIAVSQLDEETAMPPKRGGGRGGPGGGGPGGGGRGGGPGGGGRGFGPGNLLATQMVSQGDANADQKLGKDEFGKLADAWFAKLDPEKSGKLTQEQFSEKLGTVLPTPQRGGGPGGPGGGGGRGGGPGRFLGPGLFGVADSNKDGSLTAAEWKGTFTQWFAKWDTAKAGAVSEEQVREGLNAALPAPQFGGRGGPGGPGAGPGGPGGPAGGPGAGPGGPGGGGGPQSKPLTPEEVALVRAWVDQGAK